MFIDSPISQCVYPFSHSFDHSSILPFHGSNHSIIHWNIQWTESSCEIRCEKASDCVFAEGSRIQLGSGTLRISGQAYFFGRLELAETARLEILRGADVHFAGQSSTGGSLSLSIPLLSVPSRMSPSAHLEDHLDSVILIQNGGNLTISTPVYIRVRDATASSTGTSGSLLRERSLIGIAGSDAWLILDPGIGSYSLLGPRVILPQSAVMTSSLPPDPESSSGGRPLLSIQAIGGQVVFLSGHHVVSGPLKCIQCSVSELLLLLLTVMIISPVFIPSILHSFHLPTSDFLCRPSCKDVCESSSFSAAHLDDRSHGDTARDG